MKDSALQMAEAVLKAAVSDEASTSERFFAENQETMEKLVRSLLDRRYRQLKAGKSENNKNDMAAVKTLRRVLNGGIISIFICINEAAPEKNVSEGNVLKGNVSEGNVSEGNVPGKRAYDCLIWNQEGILVRGGTSEISMEGAILDFLANALGLDNIRSGECSEKMLFRYLAVLGLTLEGFGDSVCFVRRLKND